MCKLFIIVGKVTQLQARQLLANTAATFAGGNRDGFGFVAYGDNGAVARGRYLTPDEYPGFRTPTPKFVIEPTGISEEGELPKNITAMVIHGRTATNPKSLVNCHPFLGGGTYLAHNGILHWRGEGEKPASTDSCDSEMFLTWLLAGHSWKQTHKVWGGYGVFGIIDLASASLTVAKCDTGRLSWAVTTKGTHLFTTEKTDFSNLLRNTNLRTVGAMTVKPKTVSIFRLTGDRAEYINTEKWKGFAGFQQDANFRASYGATQERVYDANGWEYKNGAHTKTYKGTPGAFKDDKQTTLPISVTVRRDVDEDRADSDGMATSQKVTTTPDLPIMTPIEAETLLAKALEGLEARLNSDYLKQPGVTVLSTVADVVEGQS